jgi:hypothetical protein
MRKVWTAQSVNSERLGMAYTVRDAAERLAEYSRENGLGIFDVQIFGDPPVFIAGGVKPEVCDRHFAGKAESGTLAFDWVLFLHYMALTRIGAELGKELGTTDNVVEPVQSRLYPEIEQAYRQRFGI